MYIFGSNGGSAKAVSFAINELMEDSELAGSCVVVLKGGKNGPHLNDFHL